MLGETNFDTNSATFVDNVLDKISNEKNLSNDDEYADIIENCVRSISVIAEFQRSIKNKSPKLLSNETGKSIINGYVSHFITELILARGFIEEIERKFLEDIPNFPKEDLLIPQFDALYPGLRGVRNTLEHSAERRRGLKTGRKPIPSVAPLLKEDGTLAKCGELVIFPPSTVKCHLSDGTVGQVDLESVTRMVCELLTETIKRFPSKNPDQ